MDAEKLNQIIADKDRFIADLQHQISAQSKQIDELNKNVRQLSQNLSGFLAGQNQLSSNANTTRNMHGKRRTHESFDFRAAKNIKSTAGTSQSTLDKFLVDQNTNDDGMELWMWIQTKIRKKYKSKRVIKLTSLQMF